MEVQLKDKYNPNPSNAPVWVMNPSGVKTCLPARLATYFLEKKPGWKYCEPDEVSAEKVYPLSMDMTEQGLKRRQAINASNVAVKLAAVDKDIEEGGLTYGDLKKKAKEAGVVEYWKKTAEVLRGELEVIYNKKIPTSFTPSE